MAFATAAAVSTPSIAKAACTTTARTAPSARICVVRLAIVGKPGLRQLQSFRNARSLADGNCWGPTVVGCGPSYGGWNRRQGGQRSFEKWAEQASNSMWFPVDVEETSEEYTFVADVPGLGKNDIKVCCISAVVCFCICSSAQLSCTL